MNKHSYPLMIAVYKGEERILIIPIIDHVGGYSIYADYTVSTKEVRDNMAIGKGVINSIDFIIHSPISILTHEERGLYAVWKKNSKYKSEVSFWKNNHFARVKVYEDGHYSIYSMKRAENRNWGYTDTIKEITLPSEATEKEIGEAVIETLEASEEFYKNYVPKKPNSEIEIELLDEETKLLLIPPKDRHFEDIEDGGAAEIYRCYSYNNDDGEDIAHFYVGMAAELDCDMSPENIRSVWEETEGKADEFTAEEVKTGIFTLRTEMRNKKVHKVSYLLQMDEDLLLECTMDVAYPNRRKKVDEKLVKAFEKFMFSCKLKKQR